MLKTLRAFLSSLATTNICAILFCFTVGLLSKPGHSVPLNYIHDADMGGDVKRYSRDCNESLEEQQQVACCVLRHWFPVSKPGR